MSKGKEGKARAGKRVGGAGRIGASSISSLGMMDYRLAMILRKWKEEQEKLLSEIREVRNKQYFAPERVPDLSRRGNYDRNGYLSFTASDTFMKKYNLKEYVGRVFIQTRSYEYSVPSLRLGANNNFGLQKLLNRILPPQYKPNPQKRYLKSLEGSLLLKKKTPPKRISTLRPQI